MKQKITLVPALVILIGAALLWAGCTKPPTAEMESAESALIQAENDPDAAAYAGSTLKRARDAFTTMKSEVEAKRYDSAKSYAAETVALAEKAVNEGKTAALRAKQDAEGLVSGLKHSLGETQTALQNAKQIEYTNLDFKALDQDFDAARRTVDQAETAVAGNRYQDAREMGHTARTTLNGIMSRLSEGVRITTRKK